MRKNQRQLWTVAIVGVLAGCNPTFNDQLHHCDDPKVRPGQACVPNATDGAASARPDGTATAGPPAPADAGMTAVDAGGAREVAAPEMGAAAPEVGGAGEYELRISLAGHGSGVVGESEAFGRLSCDTNWDCEKVAGQPRCATCTARYKAGTQVNLVLVPRLPTVAASWSGECAGQERCTVVVDRDKEMKVTLDLQGATHLDAILLSKTSLFQAFALGNDVLQVASTKVNGQTVGIIRKLGRDGAWADVQTFGEAWLGDADHIAAAAATPSGAIVGLGEGAAEVVDNFAFRGGVGQPFTRFKLAERWRWPFGEGFAAGRTAANEPTRLSYFDATGKEVGPLGSYDGASPFGDYNGAAIAVVAGPGNNAFAYYERRSDRMLVLARFSPTGAAGWSVPVSTSTADLKFDGTDALLLSGRFLDTIRVGETRSAISGNGLFVASISAESGGVRWLRVFEGAHTPQLAARGAAVYLAGPIFSGNGTVKSDDGMSLRGTSFVARLDRATGKTIWTSPLAHEISNLVATDDTIWVRTGADRLYRFTP